MDRDGILRTSSPERAGVEEDRGRCRLAGTDHLLAGSLDLAVPDCVLSPSGEPS